MGRENRGLSHVFRMFSEALAILRQIAQLA